jgi:hypothetical protein
MSPSLRPVGARTARPCHHKRTEPLRCHGPALPTRFLPSPGAHPPTRARVLCVLLVQTPGRPTGTQPLTRSGGRPGRAGPV